MEDSKIIELFFVCAKQVIVELSAKYGTTALNAIEQEITAKELYRQIDCFLATLDEENQMMFVRRYWYSESIPDIAERFQTSDNNVSVHLSRIWKKLKIHLKKNSLLDI